jgi:hypothetical protein
MNKHTLDKILAPYEQRPVPADYNAEADRRAGLKLGRELNRLQGGQPNETDRRLDDLLATGRVTREEYIQIATIIAHATAKPRRLDRDR